MSHQAFRPRGYSRIQIRRALGFPIIISLTRNTFAAIRSAQHLSYGTTKTLGASILSWEQTPPVKHAFAKFVPTKTSHEVWL